jgi:hypothetical protein
MTEYQIEANTRRCSVTGRELRPGERFFSVLLDEAGKFHRRDYSTDAWHGPPEGAFGFWAGRIPASGEPNRPRIDDEVLIECLERLEGDPDPSRVPFRYVVALLLMRRKRLRFEEARMEGGDEYLVLRCTKMGNMYRVLDPRLGEEAMEAVQEEVFRLLGWQ